jgi:hypothetical protein
MSAIKIAFAFWDFRKWLRPSVKVLKESLASPRKILRVFMGKRRQEGGAYRILSRTSGRAKPLPQVQVAKPVP